MITYDYIRGHWDMRRFQRIDLWLLSMFKDRHQNGKRVAAQTPESSESFSETSMQDVMSTWVLEISKEGGAYNPPGYAQPQYDQYYQLYYPQQQHDDEEEE
ncbi:hypothetical protein Tco_0424586 [Tanacetum coccineum]